jgi:hypothetical protein
MEACSMSSRIMYIFMATQAIEMVEMIFQKSHPKK